MNYKFDKPGTNSLHDTLRSLRADGLAVRGEDLLIRFGSDTLTFDLLTKISELFDGTKKIDVGSEDREGGYCETCAYSYSIAVVNVRGFAHKA